MPLPLATGDKWRGQIVATAAVTGGKWQGQASVTGLAAVARGRGKGVPPRQLVVTSDSGDR